MLRSSHESNIDNILLTISKTFKTFLSVEMLISRN